MTLLENKILGLLIRKPMSGYDLTKILKQDYIPFGSVSHTQIYPALANLESQKLVRYHIVEQREAGRPNKKVYEVTDEGHLAMQQWVESPTSLVSLNDEFFLKAFSIWLADPNQMIERFREHVQLHQQQLDIYLHALQSKQLVINNETESSDIYELSDLLFQFVIGNEQNYINWCNTMLEYLEQRKHQSSREEERDKS